MRKSTSLILLATKLKLSMGISEPHVITWSRILECLGFTTGLPVRSLGPLYALTLVYNVRVVRPIPIEKQFQVIFTRTIF